jgi:fructose-specific phosphotransferase system IIA component
MPSGTDSITELLRLEHVRVGLEGSTKQEVLDTVIDVLDGAPEVARLETVRQDVWARENQMSTGVGKGLALPHARSGAVRETAVAVAITRQPVDFDAIDGEPVRLIFLIVGPEAARTRHIRLLGRISRLMNRDEFRQALLSATSPEEVLEAFREAEPAGDA